MIVHTYLGARSNVLWEKLSLLIYYQRANNIIIYPLMDIEISVQKQQNMPYYNKYKNYEKGCRDGKLVK